MYNNGEEACYALAVPGSGVTALNLNYEINLFGSCTNIHTTETVFYPVIQDEPTRLKVEKDNGWIGNLIAGAAVGTAAVTAGATYSDIKSGSSRSFGDFAFQLTMGAAVGFMTGASVYGIVAALPAASAAAGVEASLIAGNTSALTAVAVPGIVTAGGYAVAAGIGVVALNESYAIGSGTNLLLETAFDGDVQAYETTSMMIDLLGMGIVQCGRDNAALGQSRSNKKGVYVEKKSETSYGKSSGSSAYQSGKYSTQISPEMEKKILEGQRKSPVKNEVIGGHSPQINNSNDLFAVEELSVNADGTRNIKFVKDLQDGNISKIKKSTVFPDSWSDSKIIDTIKEVGDSHSISVRGRDGATWHRKIVDGVEVDVIKLGNDVISGYPTGKVNAPKPSGF